MTNNEQDWGTIIQNSAYTYGAIERDFDLCDGQLRGWVRGNTKKNRKANKTCWEGTVMTNYISISHWGLFPEPQPQPNPSSQFKEGWEAALGLHTLEEAN